MTAVFTKPEFITHEAIAARHGFFTRRGGASAGPYASLNANFGGGDDPEAVTANRARIAGCLGVQPDNLLGLKQVHGAAVVTVTAPWAPRGGPEADALVTRTPGLALGIITADCAPVLFHDPGIHGVSGGIIAAAHAGWRGAAAGILEATVAAMQALGARHITAMVGPCIAPASYEVGPDLRDAVLPTRPDAHAFFTPGRPGHFHFDLAAYCAARLRTCGVARVDVLGLDTVGDPERFFSHRRRTLAGGGAIGHQISAIAQ